jgi:hypothetical protein
MSEQFPLPLLAAFEADDFISIIIASELQEQRIEPNDGCEFSLNLIEAHSGHRAIIAPSE